MEDKYYLEYQLRIGNTIFWIKSVHNTFSEIEIFEQIYRVAKLVYVKF